jgi:hypothetical protein
MPISQHLGAITKWRSFTARLDRLGIQRLQPADLFGA